MLWKNIKNIFTNYFLPQRTQRFLSVNTAENTEFTKLDQYKALRPEASGYLFIKLRIKLSAYCGNFFYSLPRFGLFNRKGRKRVTQGTQCIALRT